MAIVKAILPQPFGLAPVLRLNTRRDPAMVVEECQGQRSSAGVEHTKNSGIKLRLAGQFGTAHPSYVMPCSCCHVQL